MPIADRMRGVAVYVNDRGHEDQHERALHFELGRRIARLLGLEFVGEYRPEHAGNGRCYIVATETVVDRGLARRLGVASEHDLFGGVVPAPFVATKSITHGLVAADAPAPREWSPQFAPRVEEAVLAGYTAFTAADAKRAGERLLDRGPVRVKSAVANAGRGQWVAADAAELARIVDAADPEQLATYGVVLEENLEAVTTLSVGQVRIGFLLAAYYGTQRLTEDNSGVRVYGGTDLHLVRGGFDALLDLDLPDGVRLAVRQARTYDGAADRCYRGFFASRRNYDVARGTDARGRPRSGVLEQSWRVGGASSAEILALEVLQSHPEIETVGASAWEVYGQEVNTPPGATVLFSGEDSEVGPVTKYVTLEPYERA